VRASRGSAPLLGPCSRTIRAGSSTWRSSLVMSESTRGRRQVPGSPGGSAPRPATRPLAYNASAISRYAGRPSAFMRATRKGGTRRPVRGGRGTPARRAAQGEARVGSATGSGSPWSVSPRTPKIGPTPPELPKHGFTQSLAWAAKRP
jgi:hypothetical protein